MPPNQAARSRRRGAPDESWVKTWAGARTLALKDVPAQVLVLDDVRELFAHKCAIHAHVFLLQVRALKGDFLEQTLHDGVRRRAPMFSIDSLHRAAMRAISTTASSVNESLIPSVSSSATYCLMRADLGSFRMRMKSCSFSDFNSTRIGKRPCSSGIKSLGLDTWK